MFFLTNGWDLEMSLGYVTCRGGQLFFVDCHCLTFPPTHPRGFQLFISFLNDFRFCFDYWQVYVSTFHVYTCIKIIKM